MWLHACICGGLRLMSGDPVTDKLSRFERTHIAWPDLPDMDDQPITIMWHGEDRTYWAKRDGTMSDGCPVYKLLPMDRA